jgi:hypothetical protein
MTARLWGIIGGLVVLLAIVGGIYGKGRSDGREAEGKEVAAAVAKKDAALQRAAAALRVSAVRFREIDAATAERMQAAREQLFRTEAAVAAAASERNDLYRKLRDINDARDESPCVGMPVGVPLR